MDSEEEKLGRGRCHSLGPTGEDALLFLSNI